MLTQVQKRKTAKLIPEKAIVKTREVLYKKRLVICPKMRKFIR